MRRSETIDFIRKLKGLAIINQGYYIAGVLREIEKKYEESNEKIDSYNFYKDLDKIFLYHKYPDHKDYNTTSFINKSVKITQSILHREIRIYKIKKLFMI